MGLGGAQPEGACIACVLRQRVQHVCTPDAAAVSPTLFRATAARIQVPSSTRKAIAGAIPTWNFTYCRLDSFSRAASCGPLLSHSAKKTFKVRN